MSVRVTTVELSRQLYDNYRPSSKLQRLSTVSASTPHFSISRLPLTKRFTYDGGTYITVLLIGKFTLSGLMPCCINQAAKQGVYILKDYGRQKSNKIKSIDLLGRLITRALGRQKLNSLTEIKT